MKKDEKIEEILLSDENYEKVLKKKTEKDFEESLNDNFLQENKEITDIKSVPSEMLFSKFATYEVINRQSKTRSYISGLQAEGFLGSNITERKKLLAGETDSFVNGEMFVKFIKVKI